MGKTATGNHVQAINPSAADTVIIDPNLSDIPPSGITLPPTPQGTPQAGDQEEQGLSDLEEQTPQTVAKKRHASSQLSVSTPPLKRQKKTGGQYMGMAIGDVGEGMKRSVAQREIEATQRAIEEAQRIKETPQAIIAKAMALLREDTDPEDSDFIIEAATVFLDDRKAYMYTMLEGGMRLIWLQQIIDARN